MFNVYYLLLHGEHSQSLPMDFVKNVIFEIVECANPKLSHTSWFKKNSY